MRARSNIGGFLLLLAVLISLGCGGPAQQVRVSSPFTEEHAKYFEDGLDFVSDPNTLDGHWREDWQAELDKRIELSDLIAHVKVDAIRSHWDLDRTMLQLDLSIQARMHGIAPAGSVTVSVHDGDPGYPSVKSAEARMLHLTYLLFVKWYENDIGQAVPHWHLSPDTEPVMSAVAGRIEMLRGSAASQ